MAVSVQMKADIRSNGVAFAMKAMWHTGTADILKPGGELNMIDTQEKSLPDTL